MNSDNGVKVGSKWAPVLEWIKTIIIALIIALPIRFFIAEPFIVEGASMDPTFNSRQFLIVDRLTYRFEKPSRGDVVIFEYPNNPKIYYIKRVIGLPGEKVELREGKVYINGNEVKENYISSNHISHDTYGPIELGNEQYFVMGDNRAESSDSRAWGPLDSHFIVGRPIIRLLPVNTIGILPGEEKLNLQ